MRKEICLLSFLVFTLSLMAITPPHIPLKPDGVLWMPYLNAFNTPSQQEVKTRFSDLYNMLKEHGFKINEGTDKDYLNKNSIDNFVQALYIT